MGKALGSNNLMVTVCTFAAVLYHEPAFSSQLVCRTRSPSSFFGERSRSAGPPSAMPQQTAATAAEPTALPVRVAVRCWRETAADGEPCVVV